MAPKRRRNLPQIVLAFSAGLMAVALFAPAVVRAADETSMRVVVKEAEDESPIFQAHLTLQFQESRKLKRDKWITFSAKTDKDGKCLFHHIPKGTIRLFVTADHHQSYGKELELDQDNQVFEVKLRKPQGQI